MGWVCALPVELAAAQGMLDEEHQNLSQNPNDTNLYTFGRIGEHNVVIACLPAGGIGTVSATVVAIEMKLKFTSMRFGLMVGIGGGVPSVNSELWLGDVVVSQPGNGHGGVIQYDLGKSTPSGFERTGYLNTPPTVLLNALSKLQSQQLRGKSNLASYLPQDLADEHVEPDLLFESTYRHVGGSTCVRCNPDKLVRSFRRTREIKVHYGTIASGNQVIKDGVIRDMLSLELGGVLCFEMEAAGLMNNFPCLVIRGICDYSDSHKNKSWQPYAAAAAAACAKEILSLIPALEAEERMTRPSRFGFEGEIRSVPARATNQYQNIASEFINNNLNNFYDGDSAFLEKIAQTAAARAQRATEELGLSPEFTPKLAKLGLYDFVILCGKHLIHP